MHGLSSHLAVSSHDPSVSSLDPSVSSLDPSVSSLDPSVSSLDPSVSGRLFHYRRRRMTKMKMRANSRCQGCTSHSEVTQLVYLFVVSRVYLNRGLIVM